MEHLYDDNTVFNLGFEVLTEGRDSIVSVVYGARVQPSHRLLMVPASMPPGRPLSIPFDEDALLDLANANGGNIWVSKTTSAAIGSAVAGVNTSGDPFTIEQMHVRKIPKSSAGRRCRPNAGRMPPASPRGRLHGGVAVRS